MQVKVFRNLLNSFTIDTAEPSPLKIYSDRFGHESAILPPNQAVRIMWLSRTSIKYERNLIGLIKG
jgi:hypothetical protein